MSKSPTDICANCGHQRKWHVWDDYGLSDSCYYPMIMMSERDRDGKLVGFIHHVDTCGGFVEPPEADE